LRPNKKEGGKTLAGQTGENGIVNLELTDEEVAKKIASFKKVQDYSEGDYSVIMVVVANDKGPGHKLISIKNATIKNIKGKKVLCDEGGSIYAQDTKVWAAFGFKKVEEKPKEKKYT